MKDTTYNIIRATLDGDETIGVADRTAILAACAGKPTATDRPGRFLNRRDVCQRLGLSERTVWRLTALGRIPSRKIGGARRFLESDIDGLGMAKGPAARRWREPHCLSMN